MLWLHSGQSQTLKEVREAGSRTVILSFRRAAFIWELVQGMSRSISWWRRLRASVMSTGEGQKTFPEFWSLRDGLVLHSHHKCSLHIPVLLCLYSVFYILYVLTVLMGDWWQRLLILSSSFLFIEVNEKIKTISPEQGLKELFNYSFNKKKNIILFGKLCWPDEIVFQTLGHRTGFQT